MEAIFRLNVNQIDRSFIDSLKKNVQGKGSDYQNK